MDEGRKMKKKNTDETKGEVENRKNKGWEIENETGREISLFIRVALPRHSAFVC